MKKQTSHLLMLLLAAFLWGTTFVAQSLGAELVGPFTYLMGRSWIAVVVLLPVIAMRARAAARNGGKPVLPQTPAQRKQLALGGLVCGSALCMASASQQLGMADASTAKAGFITALYVVLVPILSVVLGKRPEAKIWACVGIAVVGLYLLCIKPGGFALAAGDGVLLLCAFLFAVQILCVSHFSPLVDGVCLSWVQFLVVAVESTVLMLVLEAPTPASLMAAAGAIAYAGVFSSGVAYTLQILGQEGVPPALACMAMSMESVFSALSGWVVLGESMTGRELFGGLLMFGAVLLAQLPMPSLCRKRVRG